MSKCFFAGIFFSELVLILRQLWLICGFCCVDNNATKSVANFEAADAAADAANNAEDDGDEDPETSFPGG